MAAEPYDYQPIRGPRLPWHDSDEGGPVHAFTLPYDAERRMRAVQEYIALGWRVHPLHNPEGHGCSCTRGKTCRQGKKKTGKHPRFDKWQVLASNDPAQVERWWKRWPLANVGILTGEAGGLLVIDIDPDNGGSRKVLEELMGGSIPITPMVETGSGGYHVYFQYPAGYTISSSVSKLAPGIDIRANGAYVVAPPSRHETGNDYMGMYERGPTVPLSEVPPALLDRLVTFPNLEKNQTSQNRHAPPAHVEASAQYWLARAVERAEPRTRNDTGLWLACQLRDDGVSREDAQPVMLAYAAAVTLGSDPYTEREALDSLASAFTREPREPARSAHGQANREGATSDGATTPPCGMRA